MHATKLLPCLLLLVGCGGGLTSDPPLDQVDSGATEVSTDTAVSGESGADAPGAIELPSAPADFLFLVDRSESWSRRSDRFAGMKAAVTSFTAAHDERFAAMVFPRTEGDACEPSTYELALPFPASAASIGALLDGVTFGGKSPLGPAVAALGKTARAHAALDPTRSTSIVVLTDATPGDDETCTPFPAIADDAATTFDRGRVGGAHVHVLSVMGTAVSADHAGLLGNIASKGGGYAAFVNGGRDDVEKSSREALEDMRDRMLVCTRSVPEGAHPESLTVTFDDGDSTVAPRVADASACAGVGFYLDAPEHPKTATLCSSSTGFGGFCEATFVRTRAKGAPRVTMER